MPNPRKLPCPHCRGSGSVRLEPVSRSRTEPLEPVDLQILRSIWQFLAIHQGTPSADDISEMVGSGATPRLVSHRLRKLRARGFLSSRGGLVMVPNRTHFLDWNIELPEKDDLVVDLMDRGSTKPSTIPFRDLIKKHAKDHDDDTDE